MRVKIESSGIKGCILRDLLTGEFIIKSRRVPYSISGKNDVRELPQFFVSGRAHVHIWKARAVGKGDVIPFRGDDALLTALTAWSIMDLSAKSPDLSSRMDGMSFSVASILVHEDNGRAPMSLYKTSSSDQGKISDGGLPSPGDTSPLKVRGRDEARIRAGNASVGTTVHERAERQRGLMPGEVILNSMGVDLAVDTTINVDKTVLGMLGNSSNSRRNGLAGRKNLPDEIVNHTD